MRKLQRADFSGDTLAVAREVILGSFLYTQIGGMLTGGRVTEVEAYLGREDKASHAFHHPESPRVRVQFGPAGYVYVYLVYGLHHQLNIVTNQAGIPDVVLIRALEPTAGLEEMARRRQGRTPLTVGPGNLCKALGIDRSLYGADCTGETIWFEREEGENGPVLATRRIGIDYAQEYRDKPWRFLLAESSFVSRPRLPG